MTGTAAASVIPLLAQPILSRLYRPEHWGPMGVFEATFSILGILATGRYEQGIVLPEDDQSAAALVRLSVRVNVILTACVALLATLVWLARDGQLRTWVLWVPLAVFSTGLYQTLTFWAIRRRAFPQLAASRFVRQLMVVALWMAFGLLSFGALGLILGLVVGQLLGTLALAWQIWRTDRPIFVLASRADERAVAQRYADFPKYSLASGLLNALAQGLPRFFLYGTFGERGAGNFTFAQKVAIAPLGALGATFADVFKQQAAEQMQRHGNCLPIWRATFRRLVKFAIIPTLVLTIAAPWIFSVVFGPEYREAGVLTQIMGPYACLMLLASPLSRTLIVTENQRLDMFWQIALVLVTGTALAIGTARHDLRLAVILFSAGYAALYVVYLRLSYKLAGNPSAR